MAGYESIVVPTTFTVMTEIHTSMPTNTAALRRIDE
jgi:hypothetical protein